MRKEEERDDLLTFFEFSARSPLIYSFFFVTPLPLEIHWTMIFLGRKGERKGTMRRTQHMRLKYLQLRHHGATRGLSPGSAFLR